MATKRKRPFDLVDYVSNLDMDELVAEIEILLDPIDIIGIVTNRNPHNLYLKEKP